MAAAAATSTSTIISTEGAEPPTAQECALAATHLVVLVHGWMGNAQEMKYIETSLEREGSKYPSHKFVVVSPKVNEGRTHDGIAAGGQRLADEVTQLIQQYPQKNHDNSITTLSFVGNSLGGLYSRYAISKLPLDDITPMIFCTTATPHLGVSSHTYIPLPKWVEWAIANILRPTGRDLFGVTNIIETMAFAQEYRRPLQKFQQRIAYANAFATDFQVPTCTAAFLCPSSPHPHVTVGETDKEFAIVVQTPNDASVQFHTGMGHALDTMGWIKVFCDTRDKIPLPSMPLPFSSETSIPKQDSFTSLELIPLVTAVGTRWNIPLGHQVLVANSKSGWYSQMSARGRPMVDRMAAKMIHDIVQHTNEIITTREKECES